MLKGVSLVLAGIAIGALFFVLHVGAASFALTYDSGMTGQVYIEPDGSQCISEDTVQEREWQGDLAANQVFTTTVPFCGNMTAYHVGCPAPCFADGAAGAALSVRLTTPSQVSLTVTDGNGVSWPMHVTHLKNSPYVEQRCFVAPYFHGSITQNYGYGPLRISLTNGASVVQGVDLKAQVELGQPNTQQSYWRCPQEDWNFSVPVVTYPLPGQTVSGVVNIAVSNSMIEWTRAHVAVSGRQGIELVSSGPNAPTSFVIPWDTTGWRNGTYTLQVDVWSGPCASCVYGAIQTVPITFTVSVR